MHESAHPSPERHIQCMTGPIPGLKRPISGLKGPIPCLNVHVRPDRPISGLRSCEPENFQPRSYISSLVPSGLKSVYFRPDRIDFRFEIADQPHVRHDKGLFMSEGLNSHETRYSSHAECLPSQREKAHLRHERAPFKLEKVEFRLEMPTLFQSESTLGLTRSSLGRRGPIPGLRGRIPSSLFPPERDQIIIVVSRVFLLDCAFHHNATCL